MIQAFIEMQGKTNQKVEQVLTHMVEKNKEIKGQNKEIQSQLSKFTTALAERERGRFPS